MSKQKHPNALYVAATTVPPGDFTWRCASDARVAAGMLRASYPHCEEIEVYKYELKKEGK